MVPKGTRTAKGSGAEKSASRYSYLHGLVWGSRRQTIRLT